MSHNHSKCVWCVLNWKCTKSFKFTHCFVSNHLCFLKQFPTSDDLILPIKCHHQARIARLSSKGVNKIVNDIQFTIWFAYKMKADVDFWFDEKRFSVTGMWTCQSVKNIWMWTSHPWNKHKLDFIHLGMVFSKSTLSWSLLTSFQ